jgi:release factor glutamine methyltransferase
VELSPDAAGFLENNVATWSPGSVEVIRSDVTAMSGHSWRGSVDLIVTNPPYLRPGEELDQETRDYDPHQALFGGDDGLEVIRQVVTVSSELLRPGGVMVMEHGIDQGEAIAQLLSSAAFVAISCERDLVGRDRFTRATKR